MLSILKDLSQNSGKVSTGVSLNKKGFELIYGMGNSQKGFIIWVFKVADVR